MAWRNILLFQGKQNWERRKNVKAYGRIEFHGLVNFVALLRHAPLNPIYCRGLFFGAALTTSSFQINLRLVFSWKTFLTYGVNLKPWGLVWHFYDIRRFIGQKYGHPTQFCLTTQQCVSVRLFQKTKLCRVVLECNHVV